MMGPIFYAGNLLRRLLMSPRRVTKSNVEKSEPYNAEARVMEYGCNENTIENEIDGNIVFSIYQ